MGIANIVQMIEQAAMPRLALQQPTMIVTGSTQLRDTIHISHTPEVKQGTEYNNVSLVRTQRNDRGKVRYAMLQRFLHLYK